MRLTLAFIVVVGATLFASVGSAGNRTADVTFEALPGVSVTSGESLAYELTIKNTGSSMFTHVELRQTVPVATSGGTTTPATLASSSCNAVIQGNEAVCTLGKLGAGGTAGATLVWNTPPGFACTNCMPSAAKLLIKEGKPTNTNEVFDAGVISASLLGGDGSAETQRAAGFETQSASCTATTGNLHTNQVLSFSNPVTSAVCLPVFTLPPGFFAGFSSRIEESPLHQHPGGHPELGQSDVCVAALGEACAAGHIPVNWGASRARHIFQILKSAITTNPKVITQVFHNGFLLPNCSDDPSFSQGCVVSISGPSGNPRVWTVVADAPGNGYWDW